jgi:hypothetical protein
VIIQIQSSSDARTEFEVDHELQRAFNALHAAQIRALGGGRFMDGSGYVVLASDTDGPSALALLAISGIRAAELKPRLPPEARKPGSYATRQR